MTAGAVVTCEEMYELLIGVDKKLSEAFVLHQQYATDIRDHESRLRTLESHADLVVRVANNERDLANMRIQVQDMKIRLWAIPGSAVIFAALGIVITLVLH